MSAQRTTVAVLILAGLFVAACEDSDRSFYGTTRPKHGPDELWYNLGAEPEFLDPNQASDGNSGTMILNMFAGLTQAHPVTLEPMPDVAQGWEIRDGGRHYLFHLRQSQWSDGKPVTAHDFEFSWKRLVDPKTASRYATFLYPVRYAEEAHRRALRVRGVPKGISEDAVRSWVRDAAELDKVVLAPELSSVFLHVTPPAGTDPRAHAQTLIELLGKRPLSGERVSVSVAGTDVIAVEALSDHLLSVRLTHPVPYFLSLTAFYVTMPVPRHLLQRLQRAGIDEALWTRTHHLVNNGAYRLKEWAFRQHMVLERNPRYWDARNVKTERIWLPIIESYNTTLNLYKAGELDHIGESQLPAEFMQHLERYDDFRRSPYLGTYFLWVNTKRAPLDNPKLRAALSLAIDRESLTKYVLRAGQIPTRDMVPAGLAGYEGLERELFDPEAARALLRQSGYGPDNPPPPIAYAYNTNEAHKQVAEAVQQMWKKHLGIEVQLQNLEWKVYLKKLESHDFALARLGWIGDYADPNTFLEILRSTSGNNHSNWGSPEYDRLLDEGNARSDPASRLALLRKAEALAMADNPVIPLYVYTRSLLAKPFVQGAYSNYQNWTYFKYMWIDERYYDGAPPIAKDEPPPVVQPDPAPRVQRPVAVAPDASVDAALGTGLGDAGVDAGLPARQGSTEGKPERSPPSADKEAKP